jgi:hypothetical protein
VNDPPSDASTGATSGCDSMSVAQDDMCSTRDSYLRIHENGRHSPNPIDERVERGMRDMVIIVSRTHG